MTDFTKQFVDNRNAELAKKSPSSVQYDTMIAEEEEANVKRIDGKFQSAYDQTDLPISGPSAEKYDYRQDFTEGNTFTSDETGGVQLNNKHYKQGVINTSGFDFATGKKYQDKYADNDGHIAKGVEMLRKEDINTKTGPSYKHVDGLYSIARGVSSEGGRFDDFLEENKGPWSIDQMAIAWNGAQSVNQLKNDYNDGGLRYETEFSEPPEVDKTRGGIELPTDSYTEESLSQDKDWLDASRRVLSHFRGDHINSLSDEDIDKQMKATMGLNKWNLSLMLYFANEMKEANDPELAMDFVNLMDQYDHLEFTTEGSGRAVAGLLSDPVTYIGFGSGILATRIASVPAKMGIRNAMVAIAKGSAVDAVAGAVEGGAVSMASQSVEKSAGLREEIDPMQVGAQAAITGTAVMGIGTVLNTASSKTARGVMADKMRGSLDWLKGIDLDAQAPKIADMPQDVFDETFRTPMIDTNEILALSHKQIVEDVQDRAPVYELRSVPEDFEMWADDIADVDTELLKTMDREELIKFMGKTQEKGIPAGLRRQSPMHVDPDFVHSPSKHNPDAFSIDPLHPANKQKRDAQGRFK